MSRASYRQTKKASRAGGGKIIFVYIVINRQDGDIIIMTSFEDIKSFITCKKVISRPPKRIPKDENRCWRNDMELTTSDGSEHFSVFMRQSQILPDNFSIGLRWHCQETGKWITLIRCNGPHGGNKSIAYHNAPHMHLLAEKDYNSDSTNYPTRVNTDVNYKTYDEAIAYFCVYCGIQDADKYFPQILSISLFPDEN